jgi:hypothetical protein
MKHILWFSALCMFASIALGQSATEFTHTIESKAATSPMSANDFWIAIPKIYNTGDSGKYAEIYIASTSATTIHIRGSRFAPVDRKLKPMEQFIFRVETQDTSKSMEMTTSGIKEIKGIHIWSDGPDLSVNLYIRNAVSSGGTIILPTSRLGKEYAVASFGWNKKEGSKPGEFVIVATEDTTEVTIIAPDSLRTSTSKVYAKNIPFSISLNRGETIQFIGFDDSTKRDLSGASITSSKPIGVVSAVQYAYIQYTGADFMCEMMPPVCSWGKKYMTGHLSHNNNGGWYSVIPSQDDQVITISYYDNTTVMLKKHQPAFYRIDGSAFWESTAPFLLTYYPAETREYGIGRPTMVCPNPVESYVKETLFQYPTDTPSYNNLDIAFPVSTDSMIKIDGTPSLAYKIVHDRKGYAVSRVNKSMKDGVHRITSDTAITIFAYGVHRGMFAWGSALNQRCITPEDTLPPLVSTIGDCYKTTVTVTDTQPYASKIVHYITDSLENLRVELDSSFISGDLHNTFVYTLQIIDRSKPGKFRISVFDQAGNMTTVTSRIDARPNPVVAPTILQIPYAGTVANFRTFELTNTTVAQMVLTGPSGLRLSNGNSGFAFVAPDLSVLPVGAKRSFLVSYSSPNDTIHRDTVLFGDECTFAGVPLESINKGAVASTTGVDLGCIGVGTSREDMFLVDNLVLYELTVLSVTFDDAAHFTAVAPALPFIIAPEKRAGITVRYTPDVVDTNCTIAHITTKELGELTATVCGCGLVSGSVSTDASQNKDELTQALRTGSDFAWLAPIPNPADRFSTMRFTFGLARSANVALELFDIDGRRIVLFTQKAYPPGIHELPVNLRSLSAGSYVYRYIANNKFYTGKLTIR